MEKRVSLAERARRWRIEATRMSAGLGMGALCALVAAWIVSGSVASMDEPGNPHVWLCDRDGGEVIALDAESFVAARYPVPWPLEVAATRLGTLWVLSAETPGPGSPRDLRCFSPSGQKLHLISFERAFGLRCDAAGAAILLTGSGRKLALERIAVDGERRQLLEAPGATGWLPTTRGLVLFDDVGVALHEVESTARAERRLSPWTEAEELLDAHVNASGIWVLSEAPGLRRLRRLSADLSPLESCEWDASSELVGAIRILVHRARGWPDLLTAAGLLYRYQGRGEVRPLRPVRDAPVLTGLLDDPGTLWCLTPGACLRLDSFGRPMPGQGGFQCLVDLCLVPPCRLPDGRPASP